MTSSNGLGDLRVGFIGSGNLAEALIKGIIGSGTVSAARLIASDRVAERLVYIAEKYEVRVLNKNFELARESDIIILSVKPTDIGAAIKEIAPEFIPEHGAGHSTDKLIISVAAGVTTETIIGFLKGAGLETPVPVIRVMPNTPAMVAEGATAIAPGPGVKEHHIEAARTLFGSVGVTVTIEDEGLMNTVTGLSGSGPAYVFRILEAMVEAGVEGGLTKECSKTLAIQTVLGASRLALESEKGLNELREMVSSPGGTTIEGLKKLDEADIVGTIKSAVKAASARSAELSGK
ncbi:MAG: pyrroline-5-carboxylate reductase [Proteobacteria bacterium]|nr:pyrroline-5-carboxylate reductase [Pseudomonadota bacterium]